MHPTLNYDLARLEQDAAVRQSRLERERAREQHPSDATRRPPSPKHLTVPVIRVATLRIV
ncbi:hypothetical protein [Cellulomonas sp. HZM]|uniref:hypothetical protein n=1 Tax=Cellulomonas sp. HZM TaxID=1454010 RepID=UPI000493A718|nr:hypothetical protein [Cellulomonas sp. HZM]